MNVEHVRYFFINFHTEYLIPPHLKSAMCNRDSEKKTDATHTHLWHLKQPCMQSPKADIKMDRGLRRPIQLGRMVAQCVAQLR